MKGETEMGRKYRKEWENKRGGEEGKKRKGRDLSNLRGRGGRREGR